MGYGLEIVLSYRNIATESGLDGKLKRCRWQCRWSLGSVGNLLRVVE